jgi:hypothetical protein
MTFKGGELTGTPSQVEWAERIRLTVSGEFDRVAELFQVQARRQTGSKQDETQAVIAILEQKRVETMAHLQAGYFIREWQELSGQVREMIAKDPGFQAIRDQRTANRQGVVRGS